MEYELYSATPEKHGHGTFFYTECGNVMYSVNDDMAYHGKLCPRCFLKGKMVTLYIRGSEEAKRVIDRRMSDDRLVQRLQA